MSHLVVGYLHNGQVSGLFAKSLAHFMLAEGPLVSGMIANPCGVNVSSGRNQLVRMFLDNEEWIGTDWLMMLDADIEFAPEQIVRLLRTAQEHGPGVYAGLYYGVRSGDIFPLIYQLKDGRVHQVGNHPDGDLITPVAGTGAGFMLVHRSVFVDVEQAQHSRVFPWFQEIEDDGMAVGEDITFCLRAKAAGYPVLMDLGIKVGHHKQTVLTEEKFREQAPAPHS